MSYLWSWCEVCAWLVGIYGEGGLGALLAFRATTTVYRGNAVIAELGVEEEEVVSGSAGLTMGPMGHVSGAPGMGPPGQNIFFRRILGRSIPNCMVCIVHH